MEFFTLSDQALFGRICHRASPLPRLVIATFRNGKRTEYLKWRGRSVLHAMIKILELIGKNSILTALKRRPRWEGKKTGPSPVDRRKVGTKRSLLCDGRGIPLALSIHPAGQHDSTTIDELLDGMILPDLPIGSAVYLDKGYDSEHIREGFSLLGLKAIIPRRHPRQGRPWNLGKRRWVVERTFSWFNRFAKARHRTDKKEKNYLAVLQLAATWIILRTVLG